MGGVVSDRSQAARLPHGNAGARESTPNREREPAEIERLTRLAEEIGL